MRVVVASFNKIYSALALLVVFILAFFSGWRDVGIDRENYLLMYAGVVSSDDFLEKFFFAKDAVFLLLSILASYFSEDAELAFLLICLTSIAAKYFAVKRIAPRYLLVFLVMYAVFLSPGLEFAAMRGGLAIGFFMLAMAYSERLFPFVVFSLLTVASHMTLLPAVLLAYRPVSELLARHKIVYVAIAVATLSVAASLIALFPHGADYEDNQGTILSYALPMVTLIISQLVFYRFKRVGSGQRLDPVLQFLTISKPVIYGLIAIAFGISGTIVTASTRYLEIAWCLLLLSALILHRKSLPGFFGLLALIAFLSYLNIYRFTWLEIVAPTLAERDELKISLLQPGWDVLSEKGLAPRHGRIPPELLVIRGSHEIRRT